jgi:hypothetical protein
MQRQQHEVHQQQGQQQLHARTWRKLGRLQQQQ